MASTTGWKDASKTSVIVSGGDVGNDQSLNNRSGFNALPEGNRSTSEFINKGYLATFWTSTETNTDSAFNRNLQVWYRYGLNNYSNVKQIGISVRFVRD